MQTRYRVLLSVFLYGCLLACRNGTCSEIDKKNMTIQQIIAELKQHEEHMSTYHAHVLSTVIADSGQAPELPQLPSDIGLVRGKEVYLTQDEITFKAGKISVDGLERRITTAGRITNRLSAYYDGSHGVSVCHPREMKDVPAAHTMSAATPEVIRVSEMLQLPLAGIPPMIGGMPLNQAAISGLQDFHGLSCLRVDWSAGQKGASSGYALICPDRGYKAAYIERRISEGATESVEQVTVQQFGHIGDIWFPSVVRVARHGAPGASPRRDELWQAEQVRVNEPVSDSVFDPLLSPGTIVTQDGGKKWIVGGGIEDAVEALRSGNLQALTSGSTR